MRSRTGCLTCRTRKLKCDEVKPVCTPCRKASRECRPSEGIVFRHQQNASMNEDDEPSGSGDRSSLKSFYSYKNTFGKDSVWLDIPKQVTFVNTVDPYADETEEQLAAERQAERRHADASTSGSHNEPSLSLETRRGLEALSTAASHERVPFRTASNIESLINHDTGFEEGESRSDRSPSAVRTTGSSHASPPGTFLTASNNNINFLLNPPTSVSPPVDPQLHSPMRSVALSSPSRSSIHNVDTRLDAAVVMDHEAAFFLRHYSEAPGLWMDLYDLGTFFASCVPVRALSNPLLKHAACAYAAKQLGRVRGAKCIVGGVASTRATMESWPTAPANVDYYWYGAKHYDKAIQLLMEILGQGVLNIQSPEGFGHHGSIDLGEDEHRAKRSRQATGQATNASSDEVFAATAILSVYEFLDASGPAWSRHLSGAKSLMDIAEGGILPAEPFAGTEATTQESRMSRARKATFWNFARQDYLAAFINECQVRLNTDDLALWRDAGLVIDNVGMICPSNTPLTGITQRQRPTMREDMVSNALVWILSKVVNFIAVRDGIVDDTDDSLPAYNRNKQRSLMNRWDQLNSELGVWYAGLPETFRPVAKLSANACPFSELWYSMPMCGSAIQHYHLARILLLANKPTDSTFVRRSLASKISSIRSSHNDELRFHSYEICGVAAARPEGSVRIHSLQPLYVAGQCLTETRERHAVLEVLRDIETDLGWATEYRVNQLLKDWGWER